MNPGNEVDLKWRLFGTSYYPFILLLLLLLFSSKVIVNVITDSYRRSLKISCVVEYGYSTEIPFPRHRNERKKDTLGVINTPLAKLIVVSHHQWESEFWENTVQRIRNPTNDWNPESKFHCLRIWNLVPGIRNPRRGIQNARLSWIFLS